MPRKLSKAKKAPSLLVSQRRKLEEQRRKKEEESKSRLDILFERIENLSDPEDIMIEITDVFNDTVLTPDVGNYYTFVYSPKTPDITYDQHPLVAVTLVQRWGFRGINFHWNDYRNYTWEEVLGSLHIIEDEYINDIRNIKYAKFKRT